MKDHGLVTYHYDKIPEPPYDGKYRNIDEKMIDYMDQRCRKTIEMKSFIQYLKKNMNINKCTFYEDYSMENGFTIELHHAPLTLYDYVSAVINKQLTKNKDVEGGPYVYPHEVVNEVMELHYSFMVGLVPLNPTIHVLVHDDKVPLHPRMIVGKYKKFAKEYQPFLSEAIKEKLTKFEALEKVDPDTIPEILKYKPVFIVNSRYKSLGSAGVEEKLLGKLKERFLASQGISSIEEKPKTSK